ncbi:lipopolysaccharide biosynthesis protein [Desulfofustis limnaeus]|uniref:lipopolysaccharide biosynthesis protein n=1 Tax=Desulfofustis limnaeus TaxID=2740163 RepID=UPI0024DF6E03|nr:hypothetical protein [Desulfofustis limnaeus]
MRAGRLVVKNSLFLYLRLLVSTGLTLITTRILLINIGISDFGIYNVVAGFIMLITMFGTSMTSSNQRHFAFDLATGQDSTFVNQTFNASLRVHFVFTLVIGGIGAAFAKPILEQYLNIPVDRVETAEVLMYCVLGIFLANIMRIPYEAMMFAKEKIHLVAILGIFESFIKFIAALLLTLFSDNQLKIYGFFLLCGSTMLSLGFMIYTSAVHKECRFSFSKVETSRYLTLTTFAGWSLFGSIASMGRRQGMIIIFNYFLGSIVVAALSIASQLTNQLAILSQVVINAINPLLVKSYGVNDFKKMFAIISISTRVSVYFLLLVGIPIFFEIKSLLSIWLEEVPEATEVFVRLLLFNVLVDTYVGPLVYAIQATAVIRNYQVFSGIVAVLNLPALYYLLKIGSQPIVALLSLIVFTCLIGLIRLLYLNKILNYNLRQWVKEVLLKSMTVFLPLITTGWIVNISFEEELTRGTILLVINIIAGLVLTYFWGLLPAERCQARTLIKTLAIRRA